MSCEQAIYARYVPKYEPFDVSIQSSLAKCSQKCCDTNYEDESCGIYSYWNGSSSLPGQCHLYKFPDQPFYLPLPSVRDMKDTKDPFVNTGILMKRKIFTWIPWISIIVILFIISIFFFWK
jgi:hypothetical protein